MALLTNIGLLLNFLLKPLKAFILLNSKKDNIDYI